MLLVYPQLATPRAGPPVDPPDAVAERERAQVGELGPFSLPPRELVAGVELRLGRAQERAERFLPWIGLQRDGAVGAVARREEPERVAGADATLAHLERAPPRGPDAEPDPARLAAGSRTATGFRPSTSVRPGGSSSSTSSALDRALGRERDLGLQLVALQHAVAVELDVDLRARAGLSAGSRLPGRGGTGPQAPPARAGERRARRSARDRRAPRRRPTFVEAARVIAPRPAGVGTVSSRSRTTSSARTRCTQSSGFSDRRWARAGTATAFTSSGVTKSRPASAACARASLRIASVPRGLAPTWTLGLSRVALTTSTM